MAVAGAVGEVVDVVSEASVSLPAGCYRLLLAGGAYVHEHSFALPDCVPTVVVPAAREARICVRADAEDDA